MVAWGALRRGVIILLVLLRQRDAEHSFIAVLATGARILRPFLAPFRSCMMKHFFFYRKF